MANPELIVYNGQIYQRAEPNSRVEALAIADGRISAVGTSQELLTLRSASVNSLDLRGRAALPGLSDAHIHLLGHGMLMRTLDLSTARSIRELQKMLANAASTKRSGEWIVGRGWDQEKLEGNQYPNRMDTDVVANPVFLRRVCGHVAVANSPALAAAGIDESTLDPFGGEIVHDVTGKPDGILKERALGLVTSSIPRDENEAKQALRAAAHGLLAQGVTALHCIIEDELEFKALQELKRDGEIQQTIYAILPLNMLERISTLEKLGTWVDGFRVGGLKIYLDGSLGARTAALGTPYLDEPGSSGMLTTSSEQLTGIIERTRGSHLQLCLHAIGDKAVEMAINTLMETLGPDGCRESRHRIEHASLMPPELIGSMAKLGLVASVQPRFIYSDSWAEKRLGVERSRYLYPFKSMLRAGIDVAAGSDSPSDNSNVMEGLWSAVCRPGLSPSERLSVGEALSCYTTGAAHASFSDQDEGTLEPGKVANMVVLDRDPFDCPPEVLGLVRVVQTVVRGKVFAWN